MNWFGGFLFNQCMSSLPLMANYFRKVKSRASARSLQHRYSNGLVERGNYKFGDTRNSVSKHESERAGNGAATGSGEEKTASANGLNERAGVLGVDVAHLSSTTTDGSTALQLQRPSVLVALQDTLISIAETFFHDPNLGWLIASLNSKATKQAKIEGWLVVTLFSRQKLVMPVFEPDIVQFYAERPEERSNEQLVTIVEETETDRELMSSIPV